MELAAASWPDVADADGRLAVLPVGSTEQHGPHAPLGTDTIAAEAVARAGADAADREVAVAPAVPVGISREHRQFPGTLWVSPDAFRTYVREVADSLVAQGFDRVVVVNGHGGNTAAVREVAAELTRDGGSGRTADAAPDDAPVAAAFTWFDAVDAPDMGHAGPVETSLVLAVAPELVSEDRLAVAASGAADGWGVRVRNTDLAHDAAAFAPNGAVGDPSEADAERGAELLDAAGAALAEVLDALADRDPAELVGPER